MTSPFRQCTITNQFHSKAGLMLSDNPAKDSFLYISLLRFVTVSRFLLASNDLLYDDERVVHPKGETFENL